jgi:hypothetical protein
MGEYLDYTKMINKAMYYVVREALTTVATQGLQGKHHFFVTFFTDHEGVKISDRLKARYPEELTVVIEHQFYNLKVHEDRFEVRLSFDEILEDLVIPFVSINRFADPGVPFHLCFQYEGIREEEMYETNDLQNFSLNEHHKEFQNDDEFFQDAKSNIISLKEFRKKKENNEKA